MSTLPAFLAARLATVIGDADLTDGRAVRSCCEDWSRRVAFALDGLRATEIDEDGDEVEIDRAKAWYGLRWPDGDLPEGLSGPLAVGHVVAYVSTYDGEWMIDLTAAQFGAAGPVIE